MSATATRDERARGGVSHLGEELFAFVEPVKGFRSDERALVHKSCLERRRAPPLHTFVGLVTQMERSVDGVCQLAKVNIVLRGASVRACVVPDV